MISVTTSMNHDEEYFENFLQGIKKDNLQLVNFYMRKLIRQELIVEVNFYGVHY